MMRKLMRVLILALSCKSGNYSVNQSDQEDVLIYYSKGPCLGNCPVYNLRVFVDGTVIYREVFMVKEKKVITKRLSSEEVGDLAKFLKNNLGYPTLFRRIRDRPLTILRFDGKEFEYHASKIRGQLKEANNKIEDLVGRLFSEQRAN